MAKWRLKPVQLAQAAHKIGIEAPVSVRLFNTGPWAGQYDGYPLHVLWAHEDIDKHEDANPSHTIWHELAHALQCERDYNGDTLAMWADHYKLYYGRYISDDDKPILDGRVVEIGTEEYNEWYKQYFDLAPEMEAEAMATHYANRYPLVTIL